MSDFYAQWMAKTELTEDTPTEQNGSNENDQRQAIRKQLGICETDSFDEDDDELVQFASKTKSEFIRLQVRAQLGIVEGDDSFDED